VKDAEGSGRGLIYGTIPAFLGTEQNHEKPQDSRPPRLDLKPGPPKYEAGVLTTGPGLLVGALNWDSDCLMFFHVPKGKFHGNAPNKTVSAFIHRRGQINVGVTLCYYLW
jgi:hypothetical protein